VVGVSVVIQDVTTQKRAEQDLRESEARLAGLVDSAMDAIITTDAAQRVVLFNPSAERMFERPAAEALGGPLERFIPVRFHAAHRARVESFGQTGATARPMGALDALSGIRASGEEFPIEASISHMEVGDQTLFTVILRDVTERQQAETELDASLRELEVRVRERTAELALAHRSLREEMDERQRLEAEVTRAAEREQHRQGQELHDGHGQQLTGIGFFLSALHEQLRDVSSTAAHETLRLQELVERSIEQTQDLAKGFYPVELEELGLGTALQGLARVTTRSSGVTCRVRSDGSVADELTGPVAIQLYRIAQEAVRNTVKHAKARRIMIGLRSRDGAITLTVLDDGVGLAADGDGPPGMGFHIMRSRARAIGGGLEVRNGRKRGVFVACTVPSTVAAELAPGGVDPWTAHSSRTTRTRAGRSG